MHLPWQARRFIAVVVGGLLALTYPLWGQPFIAVLAWLTGLNGQGGFGPATALTLPGLLLGGLIASVPAAVAAVAWFIGDAAEATGRGGDAGRMEPLAPERRKAFSWLRLSGWLVVFGMLVGMLFSTSDVFQSWAGAMQGLVERIDPQLPAVQRDAVAAMLQAFPFSALALFAWSLISLTMPQRRHRWPGTSDWRPWMSLAVGAAVWLAAVLVSVVPAYLLIG
ncbi:hypothetical protein AB0K08_02445 [Citricoccus sp. NPDC055426]|uniref:hypothetical protein n=1 Tax=Citricoccus sp. NPDC055426 TaxID=3155536 RepID=UPI003431C659